MTKNLKSIILSFALSFPVLTALGDGFTGGGGSSFSGNAAVATNAPNGLSLNTAIFTNTLLMSTQLVTGATSASPFCWETNIFVASNFPDATYNAGFYAYSNSIGTSLGIWTNSVNIHAIEFFFGQFFMMNNPSGSAAYSGYLRQNAVNGIQHQGGFFATNLFDAVWGNQSTPVSLVSGQIYCYAPVITHSAQQINGAVNVTGLFNGQYTGDDQSTNIEAQIPVSGDLTADAMLLPTIEVTTWGSGNKTENDLTNQAAYILVHNLPVGGFMFDEGCGIIGRSNNIPCFDYQRYPHFTAIDLPYLHNNGFKLDMWITRCGGNSINDSSFSNPGTISNYDGSTADKLPLDLTTIKSWSFNGLAIDHVRLDSLQPTSDRDDDFETTTIINRQIYNQQANTNFYANGVLQELPAPWRIIYYGVSKYDAVMNLANTFSCGGDIFLSDNAPNGVYTGLKAETNYEQCVYYYTNFSRWVRPGHTINAFGISFATATVDISNAVNLAAMEAYSVKLEGLYWDSRAATNPINIALNTTNVMAMWQDPLVSMAMMVTNFPGTNTEMWVKKRSTGPYGFGLWLWNHTSTNSTVSFPVGAISPYLAGQNINVFDPWNGETLVTNTSGNLTFLIAPFQVRMLDVNLAGSFSTITTNIPISGGATLHITNGAVFGYN